MIQSRRTTKRSLFGLLFIVVFSLLFMIFTIPQNVTAAPPQVTIVDTANLFVNESSLPLCVFTLNLSDDDGAVLENITITLENASAGFDPNMDLALLTGGNISGIMIYQETNFSPGFQVDDSPLGMIPMGWIGSGPWYVNFYGIGHTLLNTTVGPNYYVVIRTSPFISNDESFRVGLETGSIWTNQGSIPSSSYWTKIITADTLDPFPSIVVYSENTVVKVGDWLNITANISGNDATTVWVNLTDFNGLSNAEPMIYDSGNKSWYYNITSLSEGSIDTDISRYYLEISAQDKAGKIAMDGNFSKLIDTILPTVSVGITQESNPAAIGNWINITVTTDSDTQYVSANLSAFSGQGAVTVFQGSGTNWFHNFTVLPGSLDGLFQINVTATDDAGNTNYDDSQMVSVDEVQPTVDVFIIQESDPVGVGEWINITVNTDLDVSSVFADLALAGFSNQVDNQSLVNLGGGVWFYNFTISQGSFDGSNTINIVAVDNAGQIGGNSSQTVYWDEKIPLVTVIVTQETQPAGVGNWINITVNADSDVVNVIGDLSEFSGQGASESFIDSGIYWYYNFTILPGSLEGNGVITIWAFDEAGNFNINFSGTPTVNVDEIVPQVNVNIIQESNHAGIGNWINITVTTDSDVTNVEADLASAGFSGQQDGQPLIWSGTIWYYQFTVTAGSYDGLKIVNVRAVDDAGNLGFNNSESASWDEIVPTSIISITQEKIPAAVGDWINITATTDSDVTNIEVDLASAGFSGQQDGQPLIWSGSFWYYQFTIVAGSYDGLQTINVRAVDDAGNLGFNNTESASWDEIAPVSLITITQESYPAGVGEWINITVTADDDVISVSADIASAGFADQVDDQPLIQITSTTWYYSFTISSGNTEASTGISMNLEIMDDAGNVEINSEIAYFDNAYPEPILVTVKTEAVGANYAKVGDWINITVDVGGISDIAAMWVDAPGIFEERPILKKYGYIWFLNTTIIEGTADGPIRFTITSMDFAANENNTKYDTANIDNIYPTPDDFLLVPEFIPVKIGDWINITVNLQNHSDIASIYIEAPGVLTSRPILESSDNIWYLNTTIPQGTASGEVQFNVTILDDAGNEITLSKSTNVINLPAPPVKVTPDEGISWGLVLLITCAALVGSGGVVVGATEIGHYSFFFIFYLLYTRLKKEYILDNFTRGRIYGYVEANPGEHFNAIKRALGLKNGSLAYHLRTLEKGGYIVSKHDRGYTRFYPKSMKLPKRNIKELIPIQRSIIDIIKSNPGISQRGIADKLNISYQLVHYHIKVLQEANYLNLKKDKKQTYCYETEEVAEIPEFA